MEFLNSDTVGLDVEEEADVSYCNTDDLANICRVGVFLLSLRGGFISRLYADEAISTNDISNDDTLG